MRGFKDFGISYVYVIFEDGTDLYWARSRVVEYLQASAASCRRCESRHRPRRHRRRWVFEYVLVDETGQHSLAELRSFQDWYLRYWLASVPGVAEVASIGGFVKQYQVSLDPDSFARTAFRSKDVIDRVRRATARSRDGCSSSPGASTWCAASAI